MNINDILTTKSGKLNFLEGLIRLAKCDQHLDEQEIIFYQQFAQSLGLEQTDVDRLSKDWIGDEPINVSFDTGKEKMFFLIQAVQLCWIDNNYAEAEQQEIRSIAEELGVSLAAVERVEAWAYEGIVWNRKGDALLDLT